MKNRRLFVLARRARRTRDDPRQGQVRSHAVRPGTKRRDRVLPAVPRPQHPSHDLLVRRPDPADPDRHVDDPADHRRAQAGFPHRNGHPQGRIVALLRVGRSRA
ncbi:MAG: hypothetical protein M0C28_02740 [Candidatus Moduliflexus flocculans]|nr:hypothetical protein [Candidatus Moduliflexus flocculans]